MLKILKKMDIEEVLGGFIGGLFLITFTKPYK